MSSCQSGYLTTMCLSPCSELLVPKRSENNEFVPGEPSQQVTPSTASSHQLSSQEQPLQDWPGSIPQGVPASCKVHLAIPAHTQQVPVLPEVKHSYLALEEPSATQCLAPLWTPSIYNTCGSSGCSGSPSVRQPLNS